jgi:phosphate transport system permease protein
MRLWLTNDLGIPFDQRNAVIVGLAMGFAVVPNIFSIAEDAIFSVPRHLVHGSLALGATPWQTLWRVVLLTASPGIFSAVMIGLGRAVGETMIVLMATGNTPVMDLSIFQGMRTLSANIAVEMPESEVDSTHYRVLFLAALVLFMFTFLFNTAAEVVRQRLRRKYSSL